MRLLILAMLAGVAFGQTAQWKIKFFHDKNDSAIDFRDVVAPGPGIVYAFGVLTSERERPQGVMVSSRDGGKSFQTGKLPDLPAAAHFIDAQNGWLVTPDGILRTLDGGLTWKRVSKLKSVARVWFLNAQRGFAVGYPKAVWVTNDGGAKWEKVPDAQLPPAKAENSTFTTITFRDPQHGVITGYSRPPRRDAARVPEWIDPEAQKPLLPNLMLVLETADAGATWKPMVASVFGQVSRVAFGGTPPAGFALMDFPGEFSHPSEIISLTTSLSAFRNKERAIKDIAFDSRGRVWAAGVVVPGKLNHLPIPSKVEVLQSIDFSHWYTVPVDYKAVANRVKLAMSGAEGWLVTDGGMILGFAGL